jgi:hypothetical protein
METLSSQDIREQKINKRLADIPKVYRKIYEKAVAGNSKAAAIKAFCLECCMWQKNEIINCTSLACPLFAYRPLFKSSKPPCGAMFSGSNAGAN